MNVLAWPTGYPLRRALCISNEDNRGGIIFAQQLGKVIKGSQILSLGCSSAHTSIHVDATFHLLSRMGVFWL